MLPRQLFRRKSLDQLVGETSDPRHQLRRTLGPVQLTMLGVGAIVGAGIFSTVGTAAAGGGAHIGAGPALVISFLVVAVACGFAALCYAEFAAMVPVSGSAYTYAYATLGELAAGEPCCRDKPVAATMVGGCGQENSSESMPM